MNLRKLETGNPGNILSLVQLAVKLDCSILKEHFGNCPKNATKGVLENNSKWTTWLTCLTGCREAHSWNGR